MRTGLIVAAVVLAAIFIVSGFHFRPGGPGDVVDWVYSAGICGPMHDQFGNFVGDAGPCPPAPVYPEQLEWAPFWVR
jgi:hypothetical protein